MMAPANAATMSPTYWWHVQRPKMKPRSFLGNQEPMIAVFTGPPVAWKRPCTACVDTNQPAASVAEVAMPVDTPSTIETRHSVEPTRPMPTTAVGEKRSPSAPVMKEPPAYVNMKALSIEASTSASTPVPIICSFTFV